MTTSILLAAQGQAGQGSPLPMILMMVAVFAIMWLFMIRPQQKKQKQIREFQNSLQNGASVVTGGGIYGTVKHIDTDTKKVDVEIARGVVITVISTMCSALWRTPRTDRRNKSGRRESERSTQTTKDVSVWRICGVPSKRSETSC